MLCCCPANALSILFGEGVLAKQTISTRAKYSPSLSRCDGFEWFASPTDQRPRACALKLNHPPGQYNGPNNGIAKQSTKPSKQRNQHDSFPKQTMYTPAGGDA